MVRSVFRVMPSFSSLNLPYSLFQKKYVYLLYKSFCPSSSEGIVLSVRRSCTQEPYRFLDAIALILCWRRVIRAVLQHDVRHMDVPARCGRATLQRRYNTSTDGACEVAQVNIADVEL
jgi:predicted secreted Zn-dependent protease